ncbi:MAG: transposase [Planctomyces sp.]
MACCQSPPVWARRRVVSPACGGGQRDWRGAGVRYCTHKITNAVAEGMNSKIMLIKRHAGGFRNRENFKTAIFFHCGVLSLDPQ